MRFLEREKEEEEEERAQIDLCKKKKKFKKKEKKKMGTTHNAKHFFFSKFSLYSLLRERAKNNNENTPRAFVCLFVRVDTLSNFQRERENHEEIIFCVVWERR